MDRNRPPKPTPEAIAEQLTKILETISRRYYRAGPFLKKLVDCTIHAECDTWEVVEARFGNAQPNDQSVQRALERVRELLDNYYSIEREDDVVRIDVFRDIPWKRVHYIPTFRWMDESTLAERPSSPQKGKSQSSWQSTGTSKSRLVDPNGELGDAGLSAVTFAADSPLGLARVFQSRIRAFCDEYFASEIGPVPFGGRHSELAHLDKWVLNEQASPRFLLAGPAGRGKSALLVRWIADRQRSLFAQAGWQVAFLPISMRIGTNRPSVFQEGLARRLAEITREQIPLDALHDANSLQFLVRDQLDRIADTGQRVLVVIDGLDEALGEFDSELLPTTLPTTLRLLVSARWQVGDSGSGGWLRRLRWDRHVRVETLELNPLDRTGIVSVLSAMGAPVDTLAKDASSVDRLLSLTQGEPILVRYYAEDLWNLGTSQPSISRADLDTLSPGFHSYFQRWFDYQEQAWRAEGFPEYGQTVDAALSVVAFALGPLEEREFLELLELMHDLSVTTSAGRLLDPLRRFLMGTGKPGSGFVLSHPRIAEYLREERFSARANDLTHAFANWAMDHCARINDGRLRPEDASPYVLQHLVSHLEQASVKAEDFSVVTEDGWRKAWELFEGGHRGLSADLLVALSMHSRTLDPTTLAGAWRCALTLSSIKSLGHAIPGALIVRAVEHKVSSPRQGQHLAELMNAEDESAFTLARLALRAQSEGARTELLALAVNRASSAQDEWMRASAIERLTSLLLDAGRNLRPQMNGALEALWLAARTLHHAWPRLLAMSNLIPEQSENERRQEIESAVNGSASDFPCKRNTINPASALAKEIIAAFSMTADYDEVISRIQRDPRTSRRPSYLSAARNARSVWVKSTLYARLCRSLDSESCFRLLDNAFNSALEIDLEFEPLRSRAIAELLPYVTSHQKAAGAAEILASAETLKRSGTCFKPLIEVLPHLTPLNMDRIHALAQAIVSPSTRASALLSILPHIANEQRTALIAEALNVAFGIRNAWERENACRAIGPFLPPDLASSAFNRTKFLRNKDHRANMLAAFASSLPLELINKAYDFGRTIEPSRASNLLLALLPRLPLSAREQTRKTLLDAAMTLSAPDTLSDLLQVIASHLSTTQLDQAARLAIRCVSRHGESGVGALNAVATRLNAEQKLECLRQVSKLRAAERRAGLDALAPWVEPASIFDAMTIGKAIGDKGNRDLAVAQLAITLSASGDAGVLYNLLDSTPADNNQEITAEALVMLGPHLPAEVLQKTLCTLRSSDDERLKASFVARVAPSLPDELKTDALALIKTSDSRQDKASAFLALLPFIPERLVPTALATMWHSDDSRIWRALMAKLPKDLKKLGVWITKEIPRRAIPHNNDRMKGDHFAGATSTLEDWSLYSKFPEESYRRAETKRFAIFAGMLPILSEAQRVTLVEAARALEDRNVRAEALCDLAVHWPSGTSSIILDEALEAAMALEENSRVFVLKDLAPHLPGALIERAFRQALKARNRRVDTIAVLMPFATEPLLLCALELADQLWPNERISLLSKLLTFLPSDKSALTRAAFREELVATITESSLGRFPRWSLVDIVEYLSANDLDEVLTRAYATEDKTLKLQAIQLVAASQSQGAAARALPFATGITDTEVRLEALRVLAPHLPANLGWELTRAMLDTVPTVRRDRAMAAVEACSDIVGALGGAPALHGLTRAVQDVSAWYP